MAVKFKDYYETLGVTRTATAEELKQAFRKLARVHHPDVAKNKAVGEERFKEINEAYEVLSDPDKRRRYDDLGANWKEGAPPPPGPGGRRSRSSGEGADFEFGGTGYSDFFESFFGGSRAGFGSARRSTRGRNEGANSFAHDGEDVEADLLVTLEEALHGSQRKVTLRRPGERPSDDRLDTYQIRIPPGVREGQRIRLAGRGSPGLGGGAAGNLYLRVRLARHPDLSVQEADLYYDLELAPWEAVLGVEAKIPTLDGTTALRVPPGTTSGKQLRLRGLGLPGQDGTRGNLYATVRIQVPTAVSGEERTAWEQLARISKFNPRSAP